MSDSSARRAALQRHVERLWQSPSTTGTGVASTGDALVDAALGGGLALGRLHEVIAAESGDAAAAAGFVAMCARLIGGRLVWLGVDGADRSLYPPGLCEIGLDPDRMLFVAAPDPPALLRAADEALRCTVLGGVVIELWGDPGRIDLTAGRRLMLGAERSGVTALLLRLAVVPVPSAAQTRWVVTGAPSRALEANAPGRPALDLELVRQRGRPAGMCWRVEWDREKASFRTPLSGAVAAVPVGRPPAVAGGERRRRTG